MKNLKQITLLVSLIMFMPLFADAQQASISAADARKDPVLKAMLEELSRSQQQLQLQDMQKPFFIEYRLDDITRYMANANYGALTGEHEVRLRIVRATVRVGDYKTDSSSPRGDGAIEIATTDDGDPLALRFALWSATDNAYKAALNNYTEKLAALKTVQTPPQADDFSKQKPVVLLEPVVKIDLDREAWKQRIIEGSALYRTDASVKTFAPEIETSEGSVEARALTEYLVNTEGTIVRQSAAQYHAEVAVGTQAADGMRLERSYPVSGTTAAELGTAEKFHDGVLHALTGLNELRSAPIVTDEYHGPVLFAGNAAARSFDSLFARAVEAQRPPAGSTARTVGPFASSYQTRVLPDFMRIVDDPGLTEFDGKSLLGAYQVDEQGVAAQSVTLVDNGKLENYLLAREPIKDFPESNGHGRAGAAQPARAQIGVLHVTALSGAISDDELVSKLIALGKDQGLDSVYEVQTLSGPEQPRTLYRIKVADGSRQLVRGASLGDVDLRLFRSGILATGQKEYVYNIFGDVPATVIAPPLLFDEVTVKRAEQRNDKLPYYPPPD